MHSCWTIRVVVLSLLFLSPVVAVAYPETPDGTVTIGDVCDEDNKDFTKYRYPGEMAYCKRNVSSGLKRRVYEYYEIPVSERRNYTIDHLIPLSLGGTNDQSNLWPEHKEVKAWRPDLEHDLFLELRDGKITQDEAVITILTAKFFPEDF